MRWVIRSEQSNYMRERQKQNKKKSVAAEIWAKDILKKTNRKWTSQSIWGCRLFDFWCNELGIAVEVDGMTHDKVYDSVRDEYNYYRSGIIVLRVPNYDLAAMQKALEIIETADTWAIRKQKMREEFKLAPNEHFGVIIKKVGLKKAHGNWQPKEIC